MRDQTDTRAPREPAVTISLKADPVGGMLILSMDCRRPGEPKFSPVAVRRDSLVRARNDLGDFLFAVKELVGNALHVTDMAALDRAMQKLDGRSCTLIGDLVDDRLTPSGENFVDDLNAALHDRWQWWDPPVIEIRAPADVQFPFELLSIVDRPTTPRPIHEPSDLPARCNSFLGFRAVIRRIPQTDEDAAEVGLDQDRTLQASPALPIDFIRHVGLDGPAKEQAFLSSQPKKIELRGPWPDDISSDTDEIRRRLATMLYWAGPDTGIRDQILHFACHCKALAGAGDNARVLVQGRTKGPEVDLTIGDLRREFGRRTLDGERREFVLPLVFMNACGSAELDPREASSFPAFFLNGGYRGFIGTETNVPDTFAAQMSQAFYSKLLGGQSVGDALQSAKWAMVLRYNNPLGILYTLYADQDLTVQTTEEVSQYDGHSQHV